MQLVKLVAVALLVAACSPQPPTATVNVEPPSAEQAEDLFEEAVRLASTGDFDGLCALGTGNCESILEAAGRDVPATAPRIVTNQTMTEARGTSESDAARLLVVCGVTNAGATYATEMVILWSLGSLKAAEPVYWSGMSVSTTGDGVNEPETPQMTPPPGCED